MVREGRLVFPAGSSARAGEAGAEVALQHYFAAAAGDMGSAMSLGYRHKVGLGVPKSCRAAALYYRRAAHHVVMTAANQTVSELEGGALLSTALKNWAKVGPPRLSTGKATWAPCSSHPSPSATARLNLAGGRRRHGGLPRPAPHVGPEGLQAPG